MIEGSGGQTDCIPRGMNIKMPLVLSGIESWLPVSEKKQRRCCNLQL